MKTRNKLRIPEIFPRFFRGIFSRPSCMLTKKQYNSDKDKQTEAEMMQKTKTDVRMEYFEVYARKGVMVGRGISLPIPAAARPVFQYYFNRYRYGNAIDVNVVRLCGPRREPGGFTRAENLFGEIRRDELGRMRLFMKPEYAARFRDGVELGDLLPVRVSQPFGDALTLTVGQPENPQQVAEKGE